MVTRSPGGIGRSRLAVALAALALGLAACSSGGDSSSDTDLTNGVAGKPVAGDTLTVAVQAPATSLEPATVNTALVIYTSLSYEPLIYQAADGSLEPALAESWEYNEGNTQLDITLRPESTFTDGAAVDAEAVKASLEYVQQAGGGSSQYLGGIEAIEVTGDLTLSLKLSGPNPMLADLLTQTYGVGGIISPTGLKNPEKLTVENPSQGAGAYVFAPDDTVAGDHYTYTANPDYYDKSKQHYKKVVLRVIPSPQAAINAVQTKQVDIAPGDASTAAQAKSSGQQVVAFPFVWQGLNLIDRGGEVSKPLGDVRVRQAINYAIDRETVTKAVLGEYGTPTTTTVVKDGDGWSQKAADAYPYDVDKAKQLLADAGYADGFELPVLSIKLAGIDTMTEALTSQLAEVGITLKVKAVSDEQSYVGGATDQSFPALAVGYGAQPMFIMGPGLFLPTAPVFNGFKTNDEKLVGMYLEAAAATPEDRAAIDVEMQQYLVDQAWFAPVAFSPVFYYARPDLGGVKVSAGAPVATVLDWYDTK
ncbi:MAG: ABC transporter substrate-binding protein [Aeromicrobium sp.]